MLNPAIAQSVIDHALSLGANFAELFIEKHRTSSVDTLSDKVKSVDSGIDFGIGLRIVFGSKVLYGYTNQTDADSLKKIASTLSARDLRDRINEFTSFDFRKMSDHHPAKIVLSKDAAIDSKVEYLLKADAVARAVSESISQTRGYCMQREQEIEIFNSEGLHTSDTRNYVRSGLTSIASDGTEQATGGWNDGGLLGWELNESMDPVYTGEEASRQALVNLSAKPCPSGKMPVVIGNGFGGVIFPDGHGLALKLTKA